MIGLKYRQGALGLYKGGTMRTLIFFSALFVAASAMFGWAGDGKKAEQDKPTPNETKFVLAWGKKGNKAGEFIPPSALPSTKRMRSTSDLNNARLQKFTADGNYLGGFGLPRDNPKRTSNQAGGIAVNDKGLIYLSFMGQDKVAVYTEDGKLVREWGKRGQGDGEFHRPGGIVLASNDVVYVADQCNHARHAAIGSDLDGGVGREQSPSDLDTIADLQLLPEILARRGYNNADIEGILHGNWIRFFKEAWSKRP